MSHTPLMSRGRAWLAALALVATPWLASSALAQDDPPGRVGRLGEMQGTVSRFDDEQGRWGEAERNRPLTTGDRLSTGAGSSVAVHLGSTVVRLAEGTELELVRIDDERISLRLHRGSLALHLRSREVAGEIDLVTAEAILRPLRTGLYRLDRIDDTSYASALRGALRVDEREGFTVEAGQRVELWREGAGHGLLRTRYDKPVNDDFAVWIDAEDLRDERGATSQYVSPEMTGAEELDRNGRWEQHPEYGAIWVPLAVRNDWAPYRYGRWTWVQPWGWTWVDDAPWGFAPFHYGRWLHWRGRWAWWPGQIVPRPVYAPALVAWIGGPQLGISINIGGPPVSWVPLAPREAFRPYYRATPRYEDRINHRPQPVDGRPRLPQPVPIGPITYGNQRAPGAVTTVPRDVLVRRQPVGRAVIDSHDIVRGSLPLRPTAPPPREATAPAQVQPPREATPPVQWQPPREPRPAPAVVVPVIPPVPAPAAAVPAHRNRPGEPDRTRGPDRDPQRGAASEPARGAVREAPPSRPAPAVAAPPPVQHPVRQPVQRPAQPPAKELPKEPAPARPPTPAAAPPAPPAAAPPAPPPAAPPAPPPRAAPVPPAQQPAAAPPRQRAPESERRPERDGARKGENLP